MTERKKERAEAMVELPPHALEIEQAVLGCALLEPAECMPEIVDVVGEDVSYFYDIRHQALWPDLLFLWKHGAALTAVSVATALKGAGKLEDAGGRAYLNELPDNVPAVTMLGQFLTDLKDYWRRRRVIQICSVAQRQAMALPLDLSSEQLLAGVEKDVGDVLATQTAAIIEDGKTILRRVITQKMDDYQRGGAQMAGLTTGFEYLDKMTGGMAPPEMVVLAGRPGTGKTSKAVQVCGSVVKDEARGGPVGIFSIEMTKEALLWRMLVQEAEIDASRFRTGCAQMNDFVSLTGANERMAKWAARIHVDASPLNTLQFRSRAKLMVQRLGCKFILVDYLTLMKGMGHYRSGDKRLEVNEISATIRETAKELNIPIMVLSQFSREIAKANKPPEMHDLRESGDIEQDAHQIWGLYRPNLNDEEEGIWQDWKLREMSARGFHDNDWSKVPIRVNLRLLKQRESATGEFQLVFWKHMTKFVPYTGGMPAAEKAARKLAAQDLPGSGEVQWER